MRLVIQRVNHASVIINEKVAGEIGKGLLVFLGITSEDNEQIADVYVNKLIKLRIFEDESGKTNLSLADVGGELLVVSQFTLYADCRKGNRPSFVNAGHPDHAERIYNYFIGECRKQIKRVETGEFGADMKVELVNEGPFTILLSEDLIKNR